MQKLKVPVTINHTSGVSMTVEALVDPGDLDINDWRDVAHEVAFDGLQATFGEPSWVEVAE